jgi:eukaryotic-like serine/threonine-protein kinase
MHCLAAVDSALAQRQSQPHGCIRSAIELGPLKPEESEELAGHLLQDCPDVPPGLVQTIARQSEGTPYFIQELAHYCADKMGAALASETIGRLELQEVLKSRIERLGDGERRLLEVFAVAGRPVRLDTACKAAGVAAANRQAVASLCAAHLLRTTGPKLRDEADLFHDRLRSSVVSLLPRDSLSVHHARLAVALEQDHEDLEMIATHFHRADQLEKAITYYALSADRAADSLAFDRAVRLYRESLNLSERLGRPRQELAHKLADALANAGRGREAADAYLHLAASAHPAQALELRRQAAYHYCASGHIARGRDEFGAILSQIGMRLPQSPRAAILSCLWHRLVLRLRGLRFRARSENDLSPDELAAIDISWSVSVGLTMIDTIHAADYQARNLLLALRAGEPYRIARALAWQACHMATGGVLAREQTQCLLDAAESIVSWIEQPHATGLLLVARGIAAYFEGNWADGLARCDQGEALLREQCAGAAWECATARSFALWSLYFLGNTAELIKRQPDLLSEARQRNDLLAEASLTNLSGTLMWLARNRPQEARERLLTAMRPWEDLGFRVQHFTSLASHAQIDLYGGDYRTALRRLASEWRRLKRSLLLQIEAIRIFMVHLRGSCAVAAARAGEETGRNLRLARRCSHQLRREQADWGVALGRLIGAALADLEGNRQDAIALVGIAASHLEDAGMKLYAAAARHRQGELLGGDAGRAFVAKSEAWMAEEQICDAAAMLGLYVPGFRL